MKYKIIFFITLLIGICLTQAASGSDVIFNITDPDQDDYGAGNIQYPDNPFFEKGMFDITEFTVLSDGETVTFKVQVAEEIKYLDHYEFKYKYNLPSNFFTQLIHIYIDKDHIPNSGFNRLIQGTNAKIDSTATWENAIVITSLPTRFRRELERKQPQLSGRVIIPESVTISTDKKELIVSIPVKQIGVPQKSWGYTVLMLGHDVSGSFHDEIYVKEINAAASQWEFGGGLPRAIDPNIIDLIVPNGYTQEELLSDFDDDAKKFARIYAVYGSSQPSNETLTGTITQVSQQKIIVDIGENDGLEVNSKLIVDNRMIAIVKEVFPDMAIAEIKTERKIINVKKGMKVNKINR